MGAIVFVVKTLCTGEPHDVHGHCVATVCAGGTCSRNLHSLRKNPEKAQLAKHAALMRLCAETLLHLFISLHSFSLFRLGLFLEISLLTCLVFSSSYAGRLQSIASFNGIIYTTQHTIYSNESIHESIHIIIAGVDTPVAADVQ